MNSSKLLPDATRVKVGIGDQFVDAGGKLWHVHEITRAEIEMRCYESILFHTMSRREFSSWLRQGLIRPAISQLAPTSSQTRSSPDRSDANE